MINTSTQWSFTATLFRMQRQTLYNNRLLYNAHNVFRCSSRWKVHITLNSIYFFSLTLKCDLIRNHNETSTSLLWYHRRQYRRLWNNWPFTAQWDWVTECRWLVFTELSVPTLSCASTIHTTYTDHQQWVDRQLSYHSLRDRLEIEKWQNSTPHKIKAPKLIAKKIVTLRRSAMPNLVEIGSWWYLFSLPSLQVRPLNGYWRTI